ncbi:MAG: Gldg family protein [Prolixibacteraceae bacterium]|nr:Gldg family protein [Prolixibacteraceae bacterium]
MNTKKNTTLYILVIAGIVILVNILSCRYFFRLDFTGDKRYSLSEATQNMLKDLDDPITVSAYFSEDLPPQLTQIETEFKDLLIEYKNASRGNILYEFINPGKDDKTEKATVKAGISPVLISVREKNESVQKKAYLGAILKYGDKSEAIPLIRQGTGMEYSLSTAIKKLTIKDKPVIGFIQGHHEPTLNEMQQSVKSLNILYEIKPVTLNDTVSLNSFKTVCLVAPKDTIPENQLNILDKYLSQGGNLYIAMNRVEGDMNQAYGYEIHTGLAGWLKKKGLIVDNSFVIDASCGNVSVRQQQGGFTFNTKMSFPYLPIASTFSKNAISEGLESVIFQFASPIAFTGDSLLHYTPLVMSSAKSGKESAPVYFNIQKKWSDNDFNMKNMTLAALLEGKIEGNSNSRIVLVGDGDFAVNGYGQNAHQVNEDNINLMVNSIDYLSDDTGLISLRTKGITMRPLKKIKDGTKTTLKYLNFLLPIILIIIIGLFRNQKNRILRYKRMQENCYK